MTEILRWYLWLGIYVGISLQQHQHQPQKFAMEPQDQTAIVGSTVTLPCRVVNRVGSVQWTRDDFALGNHRNLSDYVRYSMTGSDEEGEFLFFFCWKNGYLMANTYLAFRFRF